MPYDFKAIKIYRNISLAVSLNSFKEISFDEIGSSESFNF